MSLNDNLHDCTVSSMTLMRTALLVGLVEIGMLVKLVPNCMLVISYGSVGTTTEDRSASPGDKVGLIVKPSCL
jgi:hypothetical protein